MTITEPQTGRRGSGPSPFRPGQLFIGGAWTESSDGARRDVINPATAEVISSVAWATEGDVDAAVAAARAAFDNGIWSGLSGRERSRILHRVSQLIRERADELAFAESTDVGKPITFAHVVDVNTAADQYEYVASLAQHLDGSTRETPLPAFAYTRREPLGVVAAISPFNFPLILSSTKIAPALAAGNTIVHKPASDTPLSALIMAQILADAGVPDGVFNLITGSGSALGDRLVAHPGVNKVAFTGSTEVGRHVAALAGETLKPVTAELGGNAANILFADADLDQAIGTIIGAFVFNAGQFCMAGPRLLVERPIYDTVVGILSQAVAGVPIGSPTDPATVIGPLASLDQLHKIEAIVSEARKRGGDVVVGGERLDLDGGYYYKPTVIAGLPNDDSAVQEEIFGPVLTVQPFDTEEEAIRLANSTAFGLAAGLQTGSIARAHRVAAQLEAGIVWVNAWALLDPAIPFGGVKDSGWGREYGPESLHSYTRTKSVVISTGEAHA
ncbi:betaine-aldehyde dehydrogenase [Subtercola boreus]|uniref:Betaine-aldehyde dehydrogenase n=1 Tax=Subtercola boreus TaxID=120213 RepID=A0A3E0VJR0_9MICO|nr:aldehyde dehydrogenase family protein [Subtercola boreus]RFA09097.1 betaine-aldehyde dehydrogenase [Subtercola boreus]TQL53896.1 acyl-CoA reductase-like NAD-dependent aldehyde dehydrogenase [Subtercola boreus]